MRLRDSASGPARGLGATYDPACLRDPARASGPERRDDSARLRDSASYPARGLGAIHDLVRLRDLPKASGPIRSDYLESLRGLTQASRVRVAESSSITVVTSGWTSTDILRGAV